MHPEFLLRRVLRIQIVQLLGGAGCVTLLYTLSSVLRPEPTTCDVCLSVTEICHKIALVTSLV